MEPKIMIPNTMYHRLTNIVSVLLLSSTLLYMLWMWNKLPEQVPTHYNVAGIADGWGGKGSVWLMPIISTAMYVLISFMERHPSIWNTGVTITANNKERAYLALKNLISTLKLVIVFIFSYLSIRSVIGGSLGAWFLPVSMGLTFGPMIFFLIRLVRIPK